MRKKHVDMPEQDKRILQDRQAAMRRKRLQTVRIALATMVAAAFAILFLMFDVETVFLFPWAVITRDLGLTGLFSILFFLLILVLGLAYAWRKGALEWK